MEMKNEMKTKIILVTGGVASEKEREMIAESFDVILKKNGFRVAKMKIEPDGRVGNVLPSFYGEDCALNNSGKVDHDHGSYDRFFDININSKNFVTMEKIFENIIEKEKRGDYDGNPVDSIDQITEVITKWVENVAKIPVDDSGEKPHVCIVVLGGKIESSNVTTFVDAFPKYQSSFSRNNLITVHVSSTFKQRYANEPDIELIVENIKDYEEAGLSLDLIIYRSDKILSENSLQEIRRVALVCSDQIIGISKSLTFYKIVRTLEGQKVMNFIQERLQLQKLSKQEKIKGELYWLDKFRMIEKNKNTESTKISDNESQSVSFNEKG